MNDPLKRLQQTKRLLVSVLLTVAGGVLIAIEQNLGISGLWRLVPFGEIGGIVIGAGLLSVWIDRFFRREQQESDEQRLRLLLAEQAPVMRDAVIDAFAADRTDLERVASDATLDRIVENALAVRLHDKAFASAIFDDIHDQAIVESERWTDASLHITLTPRAATKTQPASFEVTVRWHYTTKPVHPIRRFVCTSDRADYTSAVRPGSDTSMWYLKPDDGFDATKPASFELATFTVNGKERTIRRSARRGTQTYTVRVAGEGEQSREPVTVAYTYRTVTPQAGHVLFFDIEQPTKDLQVTIDHTAAHLAAVSAIDLVQTVRPVRIAQTPGNVEPRIVTVDIDGWVFPRSGIALVWTLDDEA